MIPATVRRNYQIQTSIQAQEKHVEDTYSFLQTELRRGAQITGETVSPQDAIKVLDFCSLHLDADHMSVEQALVHNLNPKVVYVHLRSNYFDVAEESEVSGEIEQARQGYSRFLSLMHPLVRDSDLALSIRVEQQMGEAEIKLVTLSPRHFFRCTVLRDLQSGDPSLALRDADDPDPSLRALAILTYASTQYRSGSYSEAFGFLESRGKECGPLAAECSFLMAKAESDADRPHGAKPHAERGETESSEEEE